MVRGAGGPEVLHVIEEAPPTPSGAQVRVRVHAAGVAFGDVMRRKGVLAPRGPFTPGYDVVGVIDAHGPRVDPEAFPLGMRVAVFLPGPGLGGYRDHLCTASKELVPVPAGLDAVRAVALGLNYITAHQILHRTAALQSGQSILVHGAAGGVGTAMLDLGGRAGLTLIGTASTGKHELLTSRGCEPIDYRTQDFTRVLADRPVDAVLDPIGGAHLLRSYSVLTPRGTLVSFGVSGDVGGGLAGVIAGMRTYASLKLRADRRRLRMYNITVSPGASRAACRGDWAEMLALGAAGELDPLVGHVLPLDAVREAHALVDGGGARGKTVLRCVPEGELFG